MRLQLILAGAALAAGTLTASAATVDKMIDVAAPPEKVWDKIGPFCSIKDWHPAIANCTEANGVRTLTTKDGATFVEKQTKNEPKDMEYTYEIEKSPLPLTKYSATLSVVKHDNGSRVEWKSTYTPDSGKADMDNQALSGILQGGLDNIQKMFAAK